MPCRLAVNKLVSPGGWVDLTMTIGRDGMFNIVKENWAKWNIMVIKQDTVGGISLCELQS